MRVSGVLSEESGLDDTGSDLVVVIDPVDGSTNASRGIPWYAASLCAVDDHGPRASVVVNLATGTRYAAVRNQGATCDGRPIAPSPVRDVSDAVLVLNGYPRRHLGWKQYRAMGATALDLCSVAAGMTDGTVDCSNDQLGPWDFLGAMLVLTEAGARIGDVEGRPLVRARPCGAPHTDLGGNAGAVRGTAGRPDRSHLVINRRS